MTDARELSLSGSLHLRSGVCPHGPRGLTGAPSARPRRPTHASAQPSQLPASGTPSARPRSTRRSTSLMAPCPDNACPSSKGHRLGVRGPATERPWTCRDGVEQPTEEIVTAWVLHLHRLPRPGHGEEGARPPLPSSRADRGHHHHHAPPPRSARSPSLRRVRRARPCMSVTPRQWDREPTPS